MPRTILCGLAVAAVMQVSLARGEEPGSRDLPTASIAARHPVARPDSSREGTQRTSSSGGYWFGTAGIAAILAVVGACSFGIKKIRPNTETGALKVIGRTSLSPKHTVYLLRAGDRVLIVGAGGQGPPSLLGELTESSVDRKIGDAP